MGLPWIITWFAVSMLTVHLPTVRSAPIAISFDNCQDATYPSFLDATVTTFKCCPPKPTNPIIDGLPKRTTSQLRVRRAAECTDSAYAAKLQRGYQLMRALPDSDPRSFTQQWFIHCAYCGGSFFTNTSGAANGIDIHFNWLFLPWHSTGVSMVYCSWMRTSSLFIHGVPSSDMVVGYFLYFHERILQSLLEDPTFSLSYWHWDNPGGPCNKVGHNFPSAYAPPNVATYDENRSENAKGNGRLRFPDLSFSPLMPAAQQPLYNASAQTVISNNLNIMYQAMVSAGTTADTFVGAPLRDGDPRSNATAIGGGGSLELSAHGSVHFWTGRDPPGYIDLGALATSGRDPAFYAHHSNMDRLFSVWRTLGSNRQYSSDPDFLDASFLFYDENKNLRRVKIRDSLNTENLGYVYQATNNPWQTPNTSRCSNISYADLLAQAKRLPKPTRNSYGFYNFQAGHAFVMIIDRAGNPSGAEEFLSITGIKFDRTSNGGFDVYVNWLNPKGSLTPMSCAEYVGRFSNMAQGHHAIDSCKEMVWKASVTDTLKQIGAVAPPSQVVVTLVPVACNGHRATISFRSITLGT